MSKALKSVGTIAGGVLGGFAGGPAGALLGGALGGSLTGVGEFDVPDLPTGISTPAFSFNGGTLARRTNTPLNRLNQTQDGLATAARDIGGLRGGLNPMRESLTAVGGQLRGLFDQVRPGFGRLTDAYVTAVRNAGAESIGNLRESLSRRGVMGNSFANDAETRVRLATAQEEKKARAEAFIGEMEMSRQLLSDEITRIGAELGLGQEERAILGQQAQVISARAQVLANQLDRELNEFGIASRSSQLVSQQAIQLAQLQAMNAGNQAGFAGMGVAGAGGLFAKGGPFEGVRLFG